ncbi:MAG: Hsp20 family protein, partial [Alphaproteobacteria bacterium]
MGKPSGDEEIREIRKQLTRLVRALENMPQPGEDVGSHISGICVDTYMTETELVFQIDMPGVDQENLKVRVSRENLTIEGTRVRPAADSSKTF